MKEKEKSVSERVMRLRSLYRQGKTREPPLWRTIEECATCVGNLSRQQLGRRLQGQQPDILVEQAISLLKTKIGNELPLAEAKTPGNELTRLYEMGIDRSFWRTKAQCAKAIGISTDSFRAIELLTQQPATPRRFAFVSKVLERLRSKLTVQTGNDSDLFDRLLAGSAEEPDDHGDDIRFIIRADSFRTYDGDVTDAELEDLRRRVEDLRRCLKRLAQIKDEETRARAHRVLGRELDELFLTFMVFRKVVPTGAAAKIGADREGLQRLLGEAPK